MKTVLKKLNRETGFTLPEMLIAVVILVLITSGVLPAAVTAYKNAVDAANAQVLLSTTVSALRNELSMSWDVTDKEEASLNDEDSTKLEVKSGTVITFSSAGTGNKSQIFVDTNGTTERIMLLEYGERSKADNGWLQSDALKTSDARPLVSNAMRQTTRNNDENMTVTYDKASIDANGEYVIIENLIVKRGENTIAKMPIELQIRVMGAEPAGTVDGSGGG